MTESEEFFLDKVKSGSLIISDDGTVFNTVTQRYIGAVSKSGGYKKLSMGRTGRKDIVHIQVHRLLWIVKNGEIPKGLYINHIDGNKVNNSIDNLELVTQSRNSKHAYEMGLMKNTSGHLNGAAIFTEEEVIEYRFLYKNKKIKTATIMQQKNCCRITVLDMLKGRKYKSIPMP